MEDHEIEIEVTNLMQELQQVSKEIEIIIAPYIAIVEENLKKQDEVSAPLGIKSAEIQEKIKKLILLRGKSLKTGSGNATYRKGAIRRSWDLDKLDQICDTDGIVKAKIWNFRKETEGEPSVTIKVDTKGTSITNI